MTYAPRILDNLLEPETKKRILESLKNDGKVNDEDINSTVQLVYKAFGGNMEAAIDLVNEGFQYYLWLTKVPDRTKPFNVEETPKKKKQKLTVEEVYDNFILAFPETKNYLDLTLRLRDNSLVREGLTGKKVEDIIIPLILEVFSTVGMTREEAIQLFDDSNKGFNIDCNRDVISTEDINYCFESDILRIKLLSDFTKLKIMEIIHSKYEEKAKEALGGLELLTADVII